MSRYVDEDGEPLMDPDAHFYRDPSPEGYRPEDGVAAEDWQRERSPTPVHASGESGKPRKRLVKKSGRESSMENVFGVEDLDDWGGETSGAKKRKNSEGSSKEYDGGSSKKGKAKQKSQRASEKMSKSGYDGFRDHGRDSEINEMWNTVAGGDSEVLGCTY